MATQITIAGNVGGEPELRFTNGGTPVVGFSVAVNRKRKDGDEWVDAGTDWYRVTAWKELAQNVAATIEKGARVVVHGRIEHQEWETKEGEKRITFQIQADEIGPSLRWATAQVSRNEKRGGPPIPDEPPASYDPSEEPF